MSDQENPNPTPPRPNIAAPAVPLKKETVRITLKPQAPGAEGETVAAAPPPPSAPRPPMAPPPRPGAPTVPLSAAPRPATPGAPPAPGGVPRPAPPTAPVGSKTIPLSSPPARPTSPVLAKQTTKIGGTAPMPQAMPKATVKLTPGAAPAAPVSSVAVRGAQFEEEEEVNEGPLNIMGWVALVGAIAAVIGALSCLDKVSFFSEGTSSNKEAWMKNIPPQGVKLPMDYSPFDKKDDAGGITSEYERLQPKIPARPEAP